MRSLATLLLFPFIKAECPEGWWKAGDACYFTSQEHKTWFEAQEVLKNKRKGVLLLRRALKKAFKRAQRTALKQLSEEHFKRVGAMPYCLWKLKDSYISSSVGP